jgi:hypothetical protein
MNSKPLPPPRRGLNDPRSTAGAHPRHTLTDRRSTRP